ncbi:hypothetical protein JB92DRAFT_2629358, partial [Gautieria morchelliformis]
VVMKWVPGQEGIEGDERVDEEEKRAAKGVIHGSQGLILIDCRGTLPRSRAAEIQRYRKFLQREAKAAFSRSPRAKNAHRIDPSMSSTAFARLSHELPRRH